MLRIYLASSWRNEHQPGLVEHLRGSDYDDLRFPGPGLTLQVGKY